MTRKETLSWLSVVSLITASLSPAADLYWDGTTTGPDADGGDGTWDTTATNWDDAATGGADTAWTNGDTATFGAAGGTVTVSGSLQTQSITINSGYTFTGGATDSIDIGGGTIDSSSLGLTGANVNMNAILAGTGGLTIKAHGDPAAGGGGTQFILGNGNTNGNSFSGGLTVDGGLVSWTDDTSFGNAANTITLKNFGGLLDANQNQTLSRDLIIDSTGGTIRTYGSATMTISGQISGSGTINRTDGGTLILTNSTNSHSGAWNLQGGSLRVSGGGSLGTASITNGTQLDFYNDATAATYSNTINGGTIRFESADGTTFDGTITGASYIGVGVATAGAELTLASGATITTGNFNAGEQVGKTATVTQQAGTSVTVSGQMRIGHWGNADSTYNMEGGSLALTTVPGDPSAGGPNGGNNETNGIIYVGIDSVGTFNQTGGTVSAAGLVLDNRGNTAGTDQYNLDGGTLTLGASGLRANTSTEFNLGGGTLAASTNFTSSTAWNVNANSTIDAAGNTITHTADISGAGDLDLTSATGDLALGGTTGRTIATNFTGVGNLTKSGSSALTLSGASSHTGATTVSEGRLNLTGSLGATAVSVADGATLGGEGSIGAGGSLTLGSTTGANLPLDITTGTTLSTDDLTLNGVTNLSFETGVPTPGVKIPVISYTGTLTDGNLGTLSDSFSVPGAANYRKTEVTNNLGTLELDLDAQTHNWVGNVNTNWDIKTTANWSSTDNLYADGDAVTFADGASNLTVDIQANVAPSSVTFTNTSGTDYVINGSGVGITGTTGITKTAASTGTVTLGGTTSSYTGAVDVQGGVLKAGTWEALGATSGVTVASGAQFDVNGKQLGAGVRAYDFTIAGDGPDSLGALTNSSATGVASNAGIQNLTLSADASVGGNGGRFDIGRANGFGVGTINGNGFTLTKVGSNTVDFRGDASGSAIDIVVAGGSIVAEDTNNAFGGATGTVTVQNGARAGTWSNRNIATPVTLETGATLYNAGGGVGQWSGTITAANDSIIDAGGQQIQTLAAVNAAGDIDKTGGNQWTILGATSIAGDLDIQSGVVQVGNVGTTGSLSNSGGSITITTDGLGLRYRLSGADATLDGSTVSFAADNAQFRQHAGTATDKVTITNTTLAGTTTDGNGNAVQGLMSSLGGELVYGTGTTATFRELQLTNGNATIEAGADVTARYLNIGNGSGASGIVNQTGGTMTMEAGGAGIRIGHWGGSGRQYNISGGTLDATALANNGGEARYISAGWDGEGDMTIGGGAGTATVKGAGIRFDRNRSGTGSSASTATLLTNGVLELGNLGTQGQGTNDGLVMSGGLIRGKADATWATQMETVTATSSTIDVDAGITVNQSGLLFGDGSLSKTGDGVLRLSNGANTYSGSLSVDAGVLQTDSALAAALAVNTGGTLNVNATLTSAATINSGGTLQGGTTTTGGTGTVDTLTLNNGSLSTFRVGGGSPDQINITANDGFTVTSGATHTATIVPAGQMAVNDEFVLFDYAGTIQGDGVSGINASLPNPHYGFTVTDDTGNTQVKLTVTSIDSVIWTGAGGGTWDVNNTTSWKKESDSGATNFYEFDIVKFDNTSPGGTVNLAGTINTASVEVDSTNSYTLTGSGIGGAGALTKAGSGTLTLLNDNSYTGTTDIQAGAVEVGNGGTSGSLGGSGNINVASGATLTFDRSDNITLARTSVGDGTLIKEGSGNLTITGGNNTVDFTINDGTLLARGGGWSTGFANGKTITVNSGGTLDTVVHSLGGLGAGGILPSDIHLNGGTWLLNNEQYANSLTMTGGLTTGAGEVRTTGGGIYTFNATAGGSEMGARLSMVGGKTFAVADGAAAADLLISGPIIGGGALTKTGAGRLVSSGTNTNSGTFFIPEGTLAMTGDNSGRTGGYEVTGGTLETASVSAAGIGTSFIALKNGTLQYTGSGAESTTRALWIDAGGQSGTFDITNAAANLTMAPASGNVNQEVIKTGAGTLTMQGVISGGGAVTVNAGTMVLDATNTYTGDTTINGGTLELTATASIANSANIIVGASTTFDVSAVSGFSLASGQTLSGAGTVSGASTIDGSLAPGSSIGTITFTDDVTLAGTADFEIDANLTTADLAIAQAALVFGGDLNVTNLDGTFSEGQTFNLFDFDSGQSSGTFANVNLPGLGGGLSWDQSDLYSLGEIGVIPETSTALLAALGAISLLIRRRR